MSGDDYSERTILIAEDSSDIRFMLKQSLQMLGYRVVEATNGKEAVEIAQRVCPDLILMDLNMPVMDGLAATERIRQCREVCESVPILAITAYDTYGMKEAALEAGCIGYITKPVELDDLAKIIEEILFY